MDKTNYRYNNNISDINFRYVIQSKKGYYFVHKSIKVGYYKMLEILDLKDKKDDIGVSYNKCTTRQLQFISHLISRSDDVVGNRCNVYINDEVIL